MSFYQWTQSLGWKDSLSIIAVVVFAVCALISFTKWRR